MNHKKIPSCSAWDFCLHIVLTTCIIRINVESLVTFHAFVPFSGRRFNTPLAIKIKKIIGQARSLSVILTFVPRIHELKD